MTDDMTSNVRSENFSAVDGIDPDDNGTVELRPNGLRAAILDALYTAALSPDRDACRVVMSAALKDRVDPACLADRYIPEVARRMGEMWCSDMLGFAEVTIGTARLQSLLRDLGPEWRADGRAEADAPLILLISPRNAQHTLGCVLLGGQLRRRGYSVRLALDPARDDLAHLLHRLTFDAIFVSASQSESLEKLRQMLEFIRAEIRKPVPVAVGGGLLEIHEDVAALIGADIATSHIDEAIEFCGLRITHRSSARRATGS